MLIFTLPNIFQLNKKKELIIYMYLEEAETAKITVKADTGN